MGTNGNGNGNGNGSGSSFNFTPPPTPPPKPPPPAAQNPATQHALKLITQLYEMAQRGEVRHVAFVARLHQQPGRFAWALSAHDAAMIGQLEMIRSRAVDRAKVQ